MELQDRSRLYPSLAPAQSNIVMGSDGRLQYAPIPQSSPSAPPVPMVVGQYQSMNYSALFPPSVSPDALALQKSVNCWAKCVRIVSGTVLTLNFIIHLLWAFELSDGLHGPNKCKFYLAARIILFTLICVVAKLGLKAGALKTSTSARCFLRSIIWLGVLIVTAVGFAFYRRKMWKRAIRNHKGDRNSQLNNETNLVEAKTPSTEEEEIEDAVMKIDENDSDSGSDSESDSSSDSDSDSDSNSDSDSDSYSGSDSESNASDESDDSETREGKGHNGSRDHERGHEGRDHDRAKDHEGKGHGERDHERGEHRKGENKYHGSSGCALIGGLAFVVLYSIMLFTAFKLYSAVKRLEQAAQRGNFAGVQQPVLVYNPGFYPGNIPMGAPQQH